MENTAQNKSSEEKPKRKAFGIPLSIETLENLRTLQKHYQNKLGVQKISRSDVITILANEKLSANNL